MIMIMIVIIIIIFIIIIIIMSVRTVATLAPLLHVSRAADLKTQKHSTWSRNPAVVLSTKTVVRGVPQ